MNRLVLFALGLIAGIAFLVIAILYWAGGTGLGHHIKHGILFFALAIIAFIFAAATRPTTRTT